MVDRVFEDVEIIAVLTSRKGGPLGAFASCLGGRLFDTTQIPLLRNTIIIG